MNTAFILSAGASTRLKGLAPAGIKAYLKLGDVTWYDLMTERLKACGWECKLVINESVSDRDIRLIDFPKAFNLSDLLVLPKHKGPGSAVGRILASYKPELNSVLILYSDTILSEEDIPLPSETSVCVADPWTYDRAWEWHGATDPFYGQISKSEALVEELKAAVGCYAFEESYSLMMAAFKAMARTPEHSEVSMADVLVQMEDKVSLREVYSWEDVGTLEALEAYRDRRTG